MKKDEKNGYALAWHQIRMWWHTVAINICRQREKEKSLQWSSEAICYARKRRLSPYLMSFTLGLLCRYSGYICTLKQSELPFTVWNNCLILLNVGEKRRIKVRKSFFEQKCCAVSLGFLGLSQVSAPGTYWSWHQAAEEWQGAVLSAAKLLWFCPFQHNQFFMFHGVRSITH